MKIKVAKWGAPKNIYLKIQHMILYLCPVVTFLTTGQYVLTNHKFGVYHFF
jgi:hypothetical protein